MTNYQTCKVWNSANLRKVIMPYSGNDCRIVKPVSFLRDTELLVSGEVIECFSLGEERTSIFRARKNNILYIVELETTRDSLWNRIGSPYTISQFHSLMKNCPWLVVADKATSLRLEEELKNYEMERETRKREHFARMRESELT